MAENQINFNIIHTNTRSLFKNYDKINAFLNTVTTPPDVPVITETWINVTSKYLFQLSGCVPTILTRNSRKQGGVTLFIINEIKSEQLNALPIVSEGVALLTVKVTAYSINDVICAIYRPCKLVRVDEFSNILNTLLNKDSITNNNEI